MMQTLEHNGHGCHPSWGPRDPSQVNSPSLSPFSLSLPLPSFSLLSLPPSPPPIWSSVWVAICRRRPRRGAALSSACPPSPLSPCPEILKLHHQHRKKAHTCSWVAVLRPSPSHRGRSRGAGQSYAFMPNHWPGSHSLDESFGTKVSARLQGIHSKTKDMLQGARTGKRHFSGAGVVMLIMCIKGQQAYL